MSQPSVVIENHEDSNDAHEDSNDAYYPELKAYSSQRDVGRRKGQYPRGSQTFFLEPLSTLGT